MLISDNISYSIMILQLDGALVFIGYEYVLSFFEEQGVPVVKKCRMNF